jgi:hypothetical protein
MPSGQVSGTATPALHGSSSDSSGVNLPAVLRNKKFTSVFLADLQRVRAGGKLEKLGLGSNNSPSAAGDGTDIRPGKFQELQRERAMIVKLLGDGDASKAKDEKTESKYSGQFIIILNVFWLACPRSFAAASAAANFCFIPLFTSLPMFCNELLHTHPDIMHELCRRCVGFFLLSADTPSIFNKSKLCAVKKKL